MVAPAPPPPSNTLSLVPGTSSSFTVDLTDRYGYPLSRYKLQGAIAQVLVRLDPNVDSDTLVFTSADPTHVTIDVFRSTVTVNFLVADTNTLTIGTLYFWQLQLTLADGEVLLPVNWTPVDVNAGGSAAPAPPVFPSTVAVNQDYPLHGSLLYQTPGGCGIDNAQVRVYLLSDYQAGNLSSPVGTTTTTRGGAWTAPVLVPTGFTYVAYYCKPYEYGPDVSTPFFA